ncbi:sulfatase-like hydrolase/transferase [Thalassotalea agarivorans]|uniref:Arylsulfatase A n=1 Tax=Thalassotalea agarivorans TaxID=349064 RepID=A0A1I0GWW9_THASX|nr:sulfatase-like hydrolase/transferase [Thalassotalea agarivorans]SET75691.1 Arylsulfatase A [Thalassotalea agarivorans]
MIKAGKILSIVIATSLFGCSQQSVETEVEKVTVDRSTSPNVVIFYIDDLGWGDLGSYGATGVETPEIDRIANNGIRFTDGHSSAATCTPSRYSLLTGEHGFRSKAKILKGDAPALIQPGKGTLASMLKKAGYTTGVVGKWHLGLGDGNVDWNEAIKPGPLEIGFDYSFLLPATGDRVPTVYVENHHVVDLDKSDPITVNYKKKVGNRATGYENPEQLRYWADKQHNDTIVNGVSRIGHMAGGESALWTDEDFAEVFTNKAIDFIRDNKDKPFFLFKSYHDIHVPRLPHPRFKGKSTMGERGDAIVQMDWMTGQVIRELEALGIAENTLIIFTSDNGPVLFDGYRDNAIEMLGEHKPAGPFSGGKYSRLEAGTRVPTIAYWPGTINPKVSDALVSQMDIYASLAKLVGVDVAADEAVDSLEQLDVWLGKTEQGRVDLLEESLGNVALRHNQYKFIPASKLKPKFIKSKKIKGGYENYDQLFDLSKDPGEMNNIAEQNPALVEQFKARVEDIVSNKY